jgi:hypothetical protein
MHWTLIHAIKVPLPGVSDQADLRKLGIKYGLIDPQPPVPARVGGEHRIGVLTRSFTDELWNGVEDPSG